VNARLSLSGCLLLFSFGIRGLKKGFDIQTIPAKIGLPFGAFKLARYLSFWGSETVSIFVLITDCHKSFFLPLIPSVPEFAV